MDNVFTYLHYTSVPVSTRWRRVFVNRGKLSSGCFCDHLTNLETEYLSVLFCSPVNSVTVRLMGQRQSGTSGAAATARYQPYTSSLTVDGGSNNADRQSPGAGRMPSSATATPDHHLRHLRPAVAPGGRLRALSLGNFPGPSPSSASTSAGSQAASVGGAIGGIASSPDSDDDSGDDSGGLFGALAAMSSMPPALTLYRGLLSVYLETF